MRTLALRGGERAVVPEAPSPRTRRPRGLVAAVAAAVVTTLVAALVKAGGVELEIPDGGDTIPPSGIAFVTGVVSVVGVVIAAGLLRWSAQPAKRFVQVAVALTAISFVPPIISGAADGTVVALITLHLVAAAVMIPTLARSLHTQSN